MFEEDGSSGAAGLVIGAFKPLRSRWTWQPRLPELWLHEHERSRFREMTGKQKKAGLEATNREPRRAPTSANTVRVLAMTRTR